MNKARPGIVKIALLFWLALLILLITSCSSKVIKSSPGSRERLIQNELRDYCRQYEIESLLLIIADSEGAPASFEYGNKTNFYPVASLSKLLIQHFALNEPQFFEHEIALSLKNETVTLSLEQALMHQSGLVYPAGQPTQIAPVGVLSHYQNGNYALATQEFWNSETPFEEALLLYLRPAFNFTEPQVDSHSTGIFQDSLSLSPRDLELFLQAVHEGKFDSPMIYWNLNQTYGPARIAFGQSQQGYAELFHDPQSGVSYLMVVKWIDEPEKKILPELPGFSSRMFCEAIPSSCTENFLAHAIPQDELTGVWVLWGGEDELEISRTAQAQLSVKSSGQKYFLQPESNNRFIPSTVQEPDKQQKLLDANTLGVLEFQNAQRLLLFWNDQVYFKQQ